MNYQERLFRQTYGYGCEPSTILLVSSLAISAMSAVATAQGQKAQADAQTQYQTSLTAAQNEASKDQTAQLRVQEAQDTESRARDMEKARLASQKAQSTATVAAGEAGVSGASVDAVLNEYNAQLGQYREAALRQGQLNTAAFNEQAKAIVTNTRFSNLQINAPVAGPNYAAIGLNFASNAMGAYSAYNPGAFRKSPTPGKT